MPRRDDLYTLMLVVHDSTLQELARIIDAAYEPGAFDRAVDALSDSDALEADWEMKGTRGRYSVFIERWDGYLTCTLQAQEPWFLEGKEIMWRDYIRSGGNPDAARAP